MDTDAKKTALRMIPYGLYVLMSEAKDGRMAAATVNWVTQASFQPPLVAIGVKADSGAHAIIKESGTFSLNMLGKSDGPVAFAFFKPAARDGDTVAGQPFRRGTTGVPVLLAASAHIECRLVDTVERGDHSVFVGEVVDAGVAAAPAGRPDDAILWLKDLGEKTFYGG